MAKSNRRRFLQAAAVGAALPLIATAPALAGEPTSADASLAAIVRLRFKHLSEAQVKAVQAGIQRNLLGGEILKRFTLDPVDEPATVFVADVAE